MNPYLDLLRTILTYGEPKPTRAKLASTGEHVHAISVFGAQARFDLRQGFPATTTKKLAFKTMARELLWFLSGSTSVRPLQEQGVHIWDQWSDANGDLGPTYGEMLRRWPRTWGQIERTANEDATVDQLALRMADLKATVADPFASAGRRILINLWNPATVPETKLPPCHYSYQLGVSGKHLDAHVVMRSADAFLGVPFNIASYALLTHLIAATERLTPRHITFSFGDLHIYDNHLAQVKEQLSRPPRPLPTLVFPEELSFGLLRETPRYGDPLPQFVVHHEAYDMTGNPAYLTVDDLDLEGYDPHPALKGEVAV